MTSKRPSMRDVAAHAGVSGQTVSRVVNGKSNVDPQTRRRVLDAMSAIGFRPNRSAQSLRTGRSNAVGVVSATLASVGNSRLLEALTDEAGRRGRVVVVQTLGMTPSDGAIEAAVENLVAHGVDGIVMTNEAAAWATRVRVDVPLVLIDAPEGSAHDAVSTDHFSGACTVLEQVATRERVHHIAGPADSYAAGERERAWRSATRGVLIRGDWTAQSGYLATRELHRRGELSPGGSVAIFAANDQMALGAMRALAEDGLRVPHDVAVVGFDGNPDSAYAATPLTTVAQDFDELARRAISFLAAPLRRPRAEKVPVNLIVGASS